MPTYIVKLTYEAVDYYMEWSTIVDAPTTNGMYLEDFKQFYLSTYGYQEKIKLEDRLKRVEATGTSAFFETLDFLIESNRAGENQETLSFEQIIDKYCKAQ